MSHFRDDPTILGFSGHLGHFTTGTTKRGRKGGRGRVKLTFLYVCRMLDLLHHFGGVPVGKVPLVFTKGLRRRTGKQVVPGDYLALLWW